MTEEEAARFRGELVNSLREFGLDEARIEQIESYVDGTLPLTAEEEAMLRDLFAVTERLIARLLRGYSLH